LFLKRLRARRSCLIRLRRRRDVFRAFFLILLMTFFRTTPFSKEWRAMMGNDFMRFLRIRWIFVLEIRLVYRNLTQFKVPSRFAAVRKDKRWEWRFCTKTFVGLGDKKAFKGRTRKFIVFFLRLNFLNFLILG
jgi:hypothetical protein